VSDDPVEAPKWKPITMVTIGIVLFALLFERAGLLPSLVVLVLISSLGGEEFKLTEVIGNMVVLAILCTIGLQGRPRHEYLHRARDLVTWTFWPISRSA
jgi:hypothetical protein